MATTDPTGAEVRERIAVSLGRSVSLAKLIAVGFAASITLTLATLGGIVRITLDTNSAVKDRAVLEDRNAELEETNEKHEQIEELATDWIVYLAGQMQAAGLDVPAIELRPGAEGPP
jgi:hypothetical protein